MNKFIFLISMACLMPFAAHTQNISGVSKKYKIEIYSEKGAAFKKAADANTIAAYTSFLQKGYKNKKLNTQAKEAIFKLTPNTIAAYEKFIAKGYGNNLNNQAKKAIFKLTPNTIAAYEKFIAKGYGNSLNHQAKEAIFKLTPNTIAAYEKFIAKGYGNSLNHQAIANIYTLTAQADAVEGYRDFLRKYPNHADAAKATKRLYEIMYAIAEEENEIASYYGFLVEFPKSQKLLREKAFINMQMLEVEKASSEYEDEKSGDDDHELKERIARQLYVEAIRAKEGNDNYTFMRKYNTVLYSDLFKDTKAAFDLFRDKELARLIRQLRNDIRENTYAINRMTSAITSKLNAIQSNISNLQSTVASSQNDYSAYYERMIDLQREQANDWSDYVNTGKGPKSFFGSPKSY